MAAKFLMSMLPLIVWCGHVFADENCPGANDWENYNNRQHSVYWENDSIPGFLGAAPSDRWYTNGVKGVYSYDAANAFAPTTFVHNRLNDAAQSLLGTCVRRGVILGQLMFTPQNIATPAPQPNDRFYGGWLYLGGVMQNDDAAKNNNYTRTAELDIGVVGSYSLAEQTQTAIHSAFHYTLPGGWNNQIRGEPGVQFSFNDITRFASTSYADASYYGGVVAGTVFDNIKGGVILRWGQSMDNVPVSMIESPVIGARLQDRGFYTLFRAEVAGIAHNTFIDGSFFNPPPFQSNIQSKPLVGQATVGFVYEGRSIKATLLLSRRSAEFTSPTLPNGAIFTFGTISVEWSCD